MSDEELKDIATALKKSGLTHTSDGKKLWTIKVVDKEPHDIDFADSEKVDSFMGYAFVNKENNKIYLKPPKELLVFLNKDKKRLIRDEDKIKDYETKYGPTVFYGFYKIGSTKQSTIEKLEREIEDNEDVELTHSEMKKWAIRKTANYLYNETGPNYQPMLACIFSQVQDNDNINPDSVNELIDVLESIRPEKTDKKVVKEEVIKDAEKLNVLKKDLIKYEKMLTKEKDQEKINKINRIINNIKKEIEVNE